MRSGDRAYGCADWGPRRTDRRLLGIQAHNPRCSKVRQCQVEHRTRDQKVASSIPAGAAEEFSSSELALCADSYSVSVPPRCYRSGTQKSPVILQKVQVTPNTYAPFTQRSRSGLTMSLSILWEPVRKTSSHATRQGTLSHSRLSSLNHL